MDNNMHRVKVVEKNKNQKPKLHGQNYINELEHVYITIHKYRSTKTNIGRCITFKANSNKICPSWPRRGYIRYLSLYLYIYISLLEKNRHPGNWLPSLNGQK